MFDSKPLIVYIFLFHLFLFLKVSFDDGDHEVNEVERLSNEKQSYYFQTDVQTFRSDSKRQNYEGENDSSSQNVQN